MKTIELKNGASMIIYEKGESPKMSETTDVENRAVVSFNFRLSHVPAYPTGIVLTTSYTCKFNGNTIENVIPVGSGLNTIFINFSEKPNAEYYLSAYDVESEEYITDSGNNNGFEGPSLMVSDISIVGAKPNHNYIIRFASTKTINSPLAGTVTTGKS